MLDDFVIEMVDAAVAVDESLQVQLNTSSELRTKARTGCTVDYGRRGSVRKTPGHRCEWDEASQGRGIGGHLT